jgi:hypothetical protein
MTDVNPTGVTLTMSSIGGEFTNRNVTLYAPFHYLGPFQPMRITSVTVGSRVSLYGNIIHHVEGSNVETYLHLRHGNYKFEKPIQLLTFHSDIIS